MADEAIVDPKKILNEVLTENKGLAKVHAPESTSVEFASPERTASVAQAYGGNAGHLEYWPAEETGSPEVPRPATPGTVLEVYNPELMKDPARLKNAIYGDLVHGMHKDPHYNGMREEFKQNYTPEEQQRIATKQSWWEDANGPEPNDAATNDAYIRGWLNERGAAEEGHAKSGGTMYSPKQLQLLEKMQRYIKTGEKDKYDGYNAQQKKGPGVK